MLFRSQIIRHRIKYCFDGELSALSTVEVSSQFSKEFVDLLRLVEACTELKINITTIEDKKNVIFILPSNYLIQSLSYAFFSLNSPVMILTL